MNNASPATHYDLVLIFTAFQRNCVYASIIKELGGRYRIALFAIDRDARTESRIGNTNRQFLDLCASLGADIVQDRAVTARLEILAQSNYSEQDMVRINTGVRAQRTFWMSGVAMGNASYANLRGKRIDRVLVPDRGLYDHRIAHYGDDGVKFPEEMIQEVGMPYRKYPLFKQDLNIDYILANPTPFSFVTTQDRLDYLENVLGLMGKIRARGEVIAFKPHNADERSDYIVNKNILAVLDRLPVRPLWRAVDGFARGLVRLLPAGRVAEFLTECSIAVAYQKLMAQVVRLKDLTTYHNLNLEVFLPQVRRGLITGRSNSIWHGLFLKKPVWNCIDRDKPYFSDSKMHKYAMTYLNVHGNYHNLEFDEALFGVIGESCRSADLIQVLDNALTSY